MNFKSIAQRIGKDPKTESKEVKFHAIDYESSFTKTKDTCPKLLKAPFVHNGCEKQNHSNCTYPRRKYAAKNAQKEYSFTQDTVNLIFSHVNGVKRLQFNGKSSFEMFSFLYSVELAHLLGFFEVDPKKVCQSPKLLADLKVN